MIRCVRFRSVAFACLIVLALTGCIKMRASVQVNPDGGGQIGFSMGMTQQIKALIQSSSKTGQDPFDEFFGQITHSMGPGTIDTRSWLEGDEEWRGGFFKVDSFTDVQRAIPGVLPLATDSPALGALKSFSFVRRTDASKDRFVLDMTIDPTPIWQGLEAQNAGTPNPIDLRSVLEIQFVVQLPGTIVETNGAHLSQGSSELLWVVNGDEPIRMHAVSEVTRGVQAAGDMAKPGVTAAPLTEDSIVRTAVAATLAARSVWPPTSTPDAAVTSTARAATIATAVAATLAAPPQDTPPASPAH